MVEEECKNITDIKENKTILGNSKNSIIKKVENCKPFVASSILLIFV